jgi:hypothetical protein
MLIKVATDWSGVGLQARALLEELSHDSKLLERNGLMDYSLLVGVRNEAVRIAPPLT